MIISNKFKLFYIYEGIKRTYVPDFYLIETKEIIEIKPEKLKNTLLNKAKFKAAKEKYGKNFKVITDKNIDKIKLDDIIFLIENNKLKFIERYQIKFNEWRKNEENNNN